MTTKEQALQAQEVVEARKTEILEEMKKNDEEHAEKDRALLEEYRGLQPNTEVSTTNDDAVIDDEETIVTTEEVNSAGPVIAVLLGLAFTTLVLYYLSRADIHLMLTAAFAASALSTIVITKKGARLLIATLLGAAVIILAFHFLHLAGVHLAVVTGINLAIVATITWWYRGKKTTSTQGAHNE